MKTQFAPQLTQPPLGQSHASAELVRQRLEAGIAEIVNQAVARVDAAYSRRISQLEGQVDFLLSRTHGLNTSAMAVIYLLMQREVVTHADLVSACAQYEGAVELDRAVGFLRDLDAKLAKKRAASGEAAPG